MNWSELVKSEIEGAYRTAEKLMDLVDPGSLSWKPATGQNWMSTGQLLRHICDACGSEVKGFVAGDWGPTSAEATDTGLPPAEKLPTVGSVAEAKKLLDEDRKCALALVATAAEKRLDKDPAPAPWDPRKMPLGQRLLEVVRHLDIHRAQLFYYLKLQGKPVNTAHLWGMM